MSYPNPASPPPSYAHNLMDTMNMWPAATLPVDESCPVDCAPPLFDASSWDINPFFVPLNPPTQNAYNCSIIGHMGYGPYVAVSCNVFQDLIALSSKAGQFASVANQFCTNPGGYTLPPDGSPSTLGTAAQDPSQPANGAPRTPRKRAGAACISCHDSRKTCGASRPCDRCRKRNTPCVDRPRKKVRATPTRLTE
ncbi:hypothetical protein V8D89_002766 [Ganoderma adspersum]